ncbi:MAG: hypothetical protein ABI251_07505, partial [Mycobacteriaceae bacterium]
TFVINCNLQRLDGPVRGNGKIIQELESFFRGAGWNVIKVVWGREWDALLSADPDGALVNLMNTTPDGDYQTYKAKDGGYVREHFFGRDPRTKQLVADLSDQQIWNLKRGGHDYRKVHAAYAAAIAHKGQPTVILAKTVKGYGITHFEGRNATHQMKKLTLEDLKGFRDAQHIPISDAELEKDPYLPPYYHPGVEASEIQYLLDRRKRLGGFVPDRTVTAKALKQPPAKTYDVAKRGSGKQEVATTMAFVRVIKELLRDEEIGKRIVPIIPDEARTFGMDSWFPTLKIYNPNGQLYTSVDAELMLAYKESEEGRILHEGINEAGAVASFTAVGTSYATHGEPMIPIYIFYYITLYNEPYPQPAEPENVDVDGILKGLYRYQQAGASTGPRAQVLASGVGMPWALRAQQLLADDWGVGADVWSVTSWTELRRDGVECEQESLLNPGAEKRVPYVTEVLADVAGPVVAVSDWMRAVPDMIRQWVPGDYVTLGTDGFGFSDTRPAARRVFAVDAESVVVAVLSALGASGEVETKLAVEAAERYKIADVQAAGPSTTDAGNA